LPNEHLQRDELQAQLQEAERLSRWGSIFVGLGLIVAFGTCFMPTSDGVVVPWGFIAYGLLNVRRSVQLQEGAAKALHALDQSNIDAVSPIGADE